MSIDPLLHQGGTPHHPVVDGCDGQPTGEPSCDEKIAYWNRRWFEACEQLAEARELVRRAAPFVNAVAAMADDKTPALAWLADAAQKVEA